MADQTNGTDDDRTRNLDAEKNRVIELQAGLNGPTVTQVAPAAGGEDSEFGVASGPTAGDILDLSDILPGETIVIDAANQAMLALPDELEDVDIEFADVDMIIKFDNGAQLIVTGFGLEAMSDDPPELQFAGRRVRADEMLKYVGVIERGGAEARTGFRSQTAEIESNDVPTVQKEGADGSNEIEIDEPVEPIVIIETAPAAFSAAPSANTSGIDAEGIGDSDGRFIRRPTLEGADNPPALPTVTPTPPSSGVGVGDGPSDAIPGPRVAVEFRATLLGVTGIDVTDLAGNSTRKGSAAAAGADTDSSFAAQQRSEVINGSSGSDFIAADDSERMPTGKSIRLIEIELQPQSGNWQPYEIRVRGLPEGVTVLDAENRGDYLRLDSAAFDEDTPNHFQFVLQYDLPSDGAPVDENGFYDQFNITFDIGLRDSVTNAIGQASGNLPFAIRDVTTEDDANFNDPVTGDPIHVLNAVPPGNIIEALAGDDSIVAGAGVDTVDGGAGSDNIIYSQSDAGVKVDLATQTGAGGYAEGDRYISIENAAGSKHDDTLFGDGGSNTLSGAGGDDLLIGRGGADTLRGGDGVDTASYADSASGVVISTDGSTSHGGDAEGDILETVENIVGSAHNDQIRGTAADESFTGGAGADLLIGLGGADRLDGGAGTDHADYSQSDEGITLNLDGTISRGGHAEGDIVTSVEIVTGSDHGDRITGAAADETIIAGDGDDVIAGGAGADIIRGGGGTDSADYADSSQAVSVNLESGTGSGGDAQGDTLSDIEELTGSTHNDVLTGSFRDEAFEGGAGADIIDGAGGSDTVRYTSSESGVTISLDGSAGSGGDAEGDRLTRLERLVGSTHADVLIGTAADETFEGGLGDDQIVGGAGADIIDGGIGEDTADYSDSSASVSVDLTQSRQTGGDAEGDTLDGIENVIGSDMADILRGDGEANGLSGGAGDDLLLGGAGADILDGGDGTDIADYRTSSEGVEIKLDEGVGVGGDAEGDRLTNIEAIQGSNSDDQFHGSSRDDSFFGNAGNDVIRGGAGADIIDGGAGIDTAVYVQSGSAVTVSLADGTGTGGTADGDTLSDVENVVGSVHADTIIGSSANNRLEGGAGDDRLIGLAGADQLIGGHGFDTVDYSASTLGVDVRLDGVASSGGDASGDTLTGIEHVIGSARGDSFQGTTANESAFGGDGDDVFSLGRGADVIDGGEGFDTVDYSDSSSLVRVDLAAGTGVYGDANGDRLAGIERVVGSRFDDTLIASATGSTLKAGDGIDTLVAGAGVDILEGGLGSDLADYQAATGSVTVNLDGFAGEGDIAEGDVLTGIERITSGDYDDTLIGNSDDNVLSGGAGDDVLRGGAGADLLNGGAGTDTADYSTSTEGIEFSFGAGAGPYNYTVSGGDAQDDTLDSIENLIATDHDDIVHGAISSRQVIDLRGGDDWAHGYAGDDTIYDGDGDDRIFGGNGRDTFFAGSGADEYDGGSSSDHINFTLSDSAVTIDRQSGTGTGGYAQGDRYTSVERFTLSNHDDTFFGHESSANWASGSGGDDIFHGGDGRDNFSGGAGDDRFYGSAGEDYMHGGSGGNDVVDYSGSDAAVNVTLYSSSNSGGHAQGDRLVSVEQVVGSAFDDTLSSDFFGKYTGGGGDDTINGVGRLDFAYYDGNFADFAITRIGTSSVTITDLRDGSPLGTDTLHRVERFSFNDGLKGFGDLIDNEGPESLFLTRGELRPVIFEDFEGGASGWSNNMTTEGGGVLSEFLGRFGSSESGYSIARDPQIQVSKTFSLSGEQTQVKVSFDFYQIDSWDWEEFAVFVNGEIVSRDNFTHNADGVHYGTQNAANVLGRTTLIGSAVTEQIWRYELVVDAVGSEVTIGFGTGLDESLSSESWGIDNLSITENTSAGIGVSEFVENGAVIATARGWDSESHKTVTFSLVDDAGGRFAIDSDSGQITVVDVDRIDASENSSHDITIRITDDAGATLDRTFTIDVTDINTPPTDITFADMTITEAALSGDFAGKATGVDSDNGEALAYTLLDDAGGRFAIDSTTGQITVANPALLDFETNSSHDVVVQVEDSEGQIYSETVTIQVTDVNEAPTAINLSGETISETAANDTVAGSAASLDQDAGETFVYSLVDNAGGRFAIDADTGIIRVADGTRLDFETDASHTIEVQAEDSAGHTISDTVTISLSDAAEAPVDLVIDSTVIDEDMPNGALVGTVTATDQDAGDSFTYSLIDDAGGRFAIDASTGAVTLADASLIDYETNSAHQIIVQVKDSTDQILQKELTISVGDVNEAPTDLAITDNVIAEGSVNGTVVGTVNLIDVDAGETPTFTLTDDADGRFAINASTGVLTVADMTRIDFESADMHTVTIHATDKGGETVSKDFVISVGDVNEAPTGIGIDSTSVNENAAAGTLVGTVSATDLDALDSATFSLIDDADGRFTIDADTGRITVADPTLLDYENGASHNVTVQITDSEGLSHSETVAISVNDVNEAPQAVSLAGATVVEGASDGTLVGTVVASDPDAGDTLTFALSDDAGGRFAIDASSGAVTVKSGAVLDYEADISHQIEIQVTDSAGLTVSQTVTISVIDQNDAPTAIHLSENLIAENSANGAVVGVATTSDPDSSDSFTYALVDDAGGRFAINAITGEITIADTSLIDFETSTGHDIQIRATDSGGNSVIETLTIAISDTNDAPTALSLSANTVAEGAATDTLIGTVITTDVDSGDSFTYSLSDDAGGRFAVDEDTGIIRLADPSLLDFETANSHDVTVVSTDAGGASTSKTFTIAVTNTNETPTGLSLSASVVSEAAGIGAVIGTVSASDADAGDSFTYGLTEDAGGRFAINATTGTITVADPSLLDFETTNSHLLTVQVKDAGGLTYNQSFSVSVTDANEAPTAMALSMNVVAENAYDGALVGTVSTADPDAVDSFTYSLTDDAGGRFSVDAATGDIIVANGALLDYESADNHNLTVRVTDSGGSHYSQSFSISVTNQVDELHVASAANESFDNTAGVDTVSYIDSTVGVSVANDGSTGSGGFGEGDVINGVEKLIGSNFDDSLVGFAGDDMIDGGDGNDTIVGAGGADSLDGGEGDDIFIISEGEIALAAASINGGDGSDTVKVEASSGTHDIAALFDMVSNIEVIDYTQAALSAEIELSAGMIRSVTGDDNRLTLKIDGNDTLNITNDALTYSVNGGVYTFYEDAAQETEIAQLTVVNSA